MSINFESLKLNREECLDAIEKFNLNRQTVSSFVKPYFLTQEDYKTATSNIMSIDFSKTITFPPTMSNMLESTLEIMGTILNEDLSMFKDVPIERVKAPTPMFAQTSRYVGSDSSIQINKIILPHFETALTSCVLAHELTHSLMDCCKTPASLNLFHNEILPIFMEKAVAKELEQKQSFPVTSHLQFWRLLSTKEALKGYQSDSETLAHFNKVKNTLGVEEDLLAYYEYRLQSHLMHTPSELLAEVLYERYLTKPDYVMKNIHSVLNGNKTVEDLLKQGSINFTSGAVPKVLCKNIGKISTIC